MNTTPNQLKGLGYFIGRIEYKLLELLKIIHNLSTNYCRNSYKIILYYLYNLLTQKNFSNLSKSILIFASLTFFATLIYEIIIKNQKTKKTILSIKSEIFFGEKRNDNTEKQYNVRIIKKEENWEKLKIFLQNRNKLYNKIEGDENTNLNKPFFKIIKAFLKYEEIKKNFS